MHGECATWTLRRSVLGFPKKVNEFVRAGTALQFAPDPSGTGIARAVKFLTAQFVSKDEYVIEHGFFFLRRDHTAPNAPGGACHGVRPQARRGSRQSAKALVPSFSSLGSPPR